MTKERGAWERSVIHGFIVTRKIFRNRKNARLPVELNLVCGIRDGLNFAGLGAKPGDRIPNCSALLELSDHQGTFFRVLPNPKFADRMADQFGMGVAVATLEGCIHIKESPFIDSCDGKRDRAGTENLLKLVLRYPASFLRLFQRFLCLAKICQTPLKFGPINLSTLVEARILDCGRGWDRQ